MVNPGGAPAVIARPVLWAEAIVDCRNLSLPQSTIASLGIERLARNDSKRREGLARNVKGEMEMGSQLDVSNREELFYKSLSTGDAAVDGLFGGLLAGVLMAVYLALARLIRLLAQGSGPDAALAGFSSLAGASPLLGLLTHLAVSAVYGLIFGLGCSVFSHYLAHWKKPPPFWFSALIGLLYGLALFLLAWTVILPAVGGPLAGFSQGHLAAGHLLYGLALGIYTRQVLGG
jgi:hypothetical protein